MNFVNRIFLILVVFFTSVLLIGTGMRGIGQSFPDILISISLQGMHFTFLIGGILTVISCFKDKRWMYFFMYLIPLISLLTSLVLIIFDIRFPALLLFIFDIYILIISINYLSVTYVESRKCGILDLSDTGKLG